MIQAMEGGKKEGIRGKKKENCFLKTILFLLRYLADSNRRTRFCRPLPSHSAKVPLWFASAKVVLIFGLTNLWLCFFAVFYNITLFWGLFVAAITVFFLESLV